ncbi:Dbl homology domain-containing protein, partial [Irpex lacteus]
TWRSTVRPQVYNRLLSVYGAAEMERQEVLFRFYHAQQELCQRLQSTVRIFVLPLRRQHSKNWIPGVPTRVGRLFDWLEDIVNLHHAISEALRDIIAPWNSESPVVHVAKSVVAFVARLEVYQPYLVRYEEVRQLVVDHTATRQDEFGEFVKLQQRRKECNGYTLANLLDLPVTHLSTCIETFEVSNIIYRVPSLLLTVSLATMEADDE